jgi:Nucleotide-diphospho-sugar transferase
VRTAGDAQSRALHHSRSIEGLARPLLRLGRQFTLVQDIQRGDYSPVRPATGEYRLDIRQSIGPSCCGVVMPELDRVVVSACHGERYWLALEPWVAHLVALDGCPIEIVSLDGGAYGGGAPGVTTVSADAKGVKLQWGVGERFQIERILFHLGRGRTGIHLDFDVRIKRDFSVLSCLPYDFIVSRAYGAPSFAVEKLGFVACLGFFIAKPSAKGICEVWLHNILEETYHTDMDQNVFNAMLCEVGPPRQEKVRLGDISLDMDVFELEGCRIGVLPKEAVERNLDTRTSIFGNHARPILDGFLMQAMWAHPVKVSKQLLSTSAVGPTIIRLRNFVRQLTGVSFSAPAK